MLRYYTYLEEVVVLLASSSVEIPPFPRALLPPEGVEVAFGVVGFAEAGEDVEAEASFDSEAAL